MTHPVIGVIGKKRHGKDSIAKILVERHGFRRFAFADRLKDVALEIDPIVVPGEQCAGIEDWRLSDAIEDRGWESAKEIPEVRRFLQNLGTAIRGANPGFWIEAIEEEVRDQRVHSPVVIADVRFPNEYRWIRDDLGGTVVRVYRPGLPDGDDHPSETALDNYVPDRLILNDGTLDDLATQVDYLATPQRWATGI